MFNLNKVMLGGNLTRDCENHTTPGGLTICEFGLAVNRRMKDKDETCFVNVTVFGKQAEACAKYLAKGNNVYIEGRLVYETWEDRGSGAKRSALKVIADAVQFVSCKNDGGRENAPDGRENGGRSRERRESKSGVSGVSGEYGPPPAQNDNDNDDNGELPPF